MLIITESVNMSPRKAIVSSKAGQKNADKDAASAMSDRDPVKPRTRKPRVSAAVPVPIKIEPMVESVEIVLEQPQAGDLPPTTPAPELFSPTPEPSTLKAQDNKKPDAFVKHQGHRVADANLEGPIRPSRRARASISYAEPSLNTKMRRPDKSLVDAIYRPNSGDPVSETRKAVRTVVIKKEKEDDDTGSAWKSMVSVPSVEPASPSEQKAKSLLPKQQGRVAKNDIEHKSTDAVISALTSGENWDGRRLSDQMRDLAIYDLKGSSPAVAEQDTREAGRQRRHTSISEDLDVVSMPSGQVPNALDAIKSAELKANAHGRSSSLSAKAGTSFGGRSDRAARRRSMIV